MSAAIPQSPESRPRPQADRVVCPCYQVAESTVRQAIDVYGAASLGDIRSKTCAGQGCRGCHVRLRRMLTGSPPGGPFALCDGCGYAATICRCCDSSSCFPSGT